MKGAATAITALLAGGSMLLGGCASLHAGSELRRDGPLLFPPEASGLVCTTPKTHNPLILATHTDVAPGHRIRIESVAPADVKGQTVESVDIVPILGSLAMMVEPVPPTKPFREAWRRRVAAVGAVVESTGRAQLAAVLRVDSERRSSLGGFEITYTDLDTGMKFAARTNLSLRVEPEACGR